MAIPGLSTVTQSLTGAANSVISSATGAVNSAATSITSTISGGVGSITASLRSINLPKGGEVNTSSGNAQALFGSTDVNNDWRVRLSIPAIPGFSDSPVLAPLRAIGNMVFPYTPTVQLSHTANYNDIGLTHQNYQFSAYENSRVDSIIITAPFNVEDGQQAKYWVAALHYFRSVTKMFSGEDADAGNPPPIVKLNGYGEYVFNNVPVVVKSFSFDLPQDADYIPADQSLLSGIPGIGTFLGAGVKTSRVPTKSTLSVTLQPIYSRTAARYFSLVKFVKGEYVSTGGYV